MMHFRTCNLRHYFTECSPFRNGDDNFENSFSGHSTSGQWDAFCNEWGFNDNDNAETLRNEMCVFEYMYLCDCDIEKAKVSGKCGQQRKMIREKKKETKLLSP